MNSIRALVVLVALGRVARAQDEFEIQVYDADTAKAGEAGLEVHANYHLIHAAPDQAHLTLEPHYGVTEWFEAGLYLPLYSIDKNLGAVINGFKLRTLFAVPHADDRRFFYGANFEFSVNAKHWDPKTFSSEVRPIIGWHLHPVDIIINPILDTEYDGFKNL